MHLADIVTDSAAKWSRLLQFHVREYATLQATVNVVEEATDVWMAPEATQFTYVGQNDFVHLETFPEGSVNGIQGRLPSTTTQEGNEAQI